MSENADHIRRMIAEGRDDFHFTRVASLLDERDALADRCEKLREAADRARGCIKLLIGRKPVRDVTETLAELDSALAAPKDAP